MSTPQPTSTHVVSLAAAAAVLPTQAGPAAAGSQDSEAVRTFMGACVATDPTHADAPKIPSANGFVADRHGSRVREPLKIEAGRTAGGDSDACVALPRQTDAVAPADGLVRQRAVSGHDVSYATRSGRRTSISAVRGQHAMVLFVAPGGGRTMISVFAPKT